MWFKSNKESDSEIGNFIMQLGRNIIEKNGNRIGSHEDKQKPRKEFKKNKVLSMGTPTNDPK